MFNLPASTQADPSRLAETTTCRSEAGEPSTLQFIIGRLALTHFFNNAQIYQFSKI